jgi:NADH dehydrogenase
VIGRLAGVTNIGWLGPFGKQGGFTAWLMWLVIHIFYLIGFANRIVVVVRWAWSFFTAGRGTRLITGTPLLPPIEEPAAPGGSHATPAASAEPKDGISSRGGS